MIMICINTQQHYMTFSLINAVKNVPLQITHFL